MSDKDGISRSGKGIIVIFPAFDSPTQSERSARFWSRIDKSGGPDACWPWRSTLDKNGYGIFNITANVQRGAHTLAMESRLGRKLAEGEVTRHQCHNPKCCNPSHLIPGTRGDNNRDTKAAGRNSKGERHPCAKLDCCRVSGIRELLLQGRSLLSLARQFGVSKYLILQIKKDRIWKDVPWPQTQEAHA